MASAAKGKKRVQFTFNTKPGATVFVAGTFNGWDPSSHPLLDPADTGQFSRACFLPKGAYEYRFVVDGRWCEDPQRSERKPNAFGGSNSVLIVA